MRHPSPPALAEANGVVVGSKRMVGVFLPALSPPFLVHTHLLYNASLLNALK